MAHENLKAAIAKIKGKAGAKKADGKAAVLAVSHPQEVHFHKHVHHHAPEEPEQKMSPNEAQLGWGND